MRGDQFVKECAYILHTVAPCDLDLDVRGRRSFKNVDNGFYTEYTPLEWLVHSIIRGQSMELVNQAFYSCSEQLPNGRDSVESQRRTGSMVGYFGLSQQVKLSCPLHKNNPILKALFIG